MNSRGFGVLLLFLFCSSSALADVWVVTPGGYYVLSIGASGVPTVVPASGVTHHLILGAPQPPPPDQPPPPGSDRWGLIGLSETEARKVSDPLTAAKLSATWQQIGRLVQSGTIVNERQAEQAIALAYPLVVGSAKAKWEVWFAAVTARYKATVFTSPADAGQGLIDIGLGVGRTSSVTQGQIERALQTADDALAAQLVAAERGDFLKFLLEVLIPLILRLIELFGKTPGG